MSQRILFCRATPLAPEPRIYRMAQTLINSGYSITVLGWDMTGEYPLSETWQSVRVLRLRLPVRLGRGLANVRHQLRWQMSLLRWLTAHQREYDLIHACDFDTILPALLARALFRKQVIYDIFDFYADMLRLTPVALKRMIRRIDLWAIGRADGVILADEARQAQIAGALPRRISIVYNTPDEASAGLASLNDTAEFREGLQLVYVGLLQRERGLFQILEAMKGHPQWRLDLAGYGPEADMLASHASTMENVTWHGRVDHHTAQALNARADVMVATFDPALPNHRYSSSNKLFEAMLLGKPIIVARETNMDHLVETHQCGLVIPYGDQQALVGALGKLEADPILRQTLGKNARLAYETTFNWQIMQTRLLGLYKELAD
jgi:glycosyltransferase involved in cell wall biosynthesis